MKRGAIFDMDGTLLDTERIYQEGWYNVAREFGEEPSDELPKLVSGASGPYMYNLVTRFYPKVDPHEYVEHVVAYVKRKTETELSLMPGVREILTFFRENGVKIAVASSSSSSVIKTNLKHAGIWDLFDAAVGGDEITNGKPAPDIFLKAASLINLPPEDCYVFEDSLNGVRAGAAAGCAAVMIPDQVQPTEEIKTIVAAIYPSLVVALDAVKKGAL